MDDAMRRTPPGGEKNVWLTVRETYTMLRISKTKLYDLLRSGQIKAKKIGRRTIISLQSIEAYTLEDWKESFA